MHILPRTRLIFPLFVSFVSPIQCKCFEICRNVLCLLGA